MNITSLKQQIVFYLNLVRILPVALPYIFAQGREGVKSDLEVQVTKHNLSDCGLLSLCKLLYSDKYYRSVYYHRVGKVSKLFRFLLPCSETFCISPGVIIGKGIFPAHPFATYINAYSIGDYFSFRNNITIGNKSDERYEETPVIGDNVSVGANSVIIGGIHIGNNVIIGAGSVVIRDVPDNSVVAGNPAKIIKRLV